MLGPYEAAVEVVDPGVVGALEADGLAALALFDRGAPVAAHVVERADLVVPAADQEHALAQHVADEEAAGLGDLFCAADGEPVALQDVLALPVEDRRILVGPRRQEGGRSVLAADGRELVGGQDRHARIVPRRMPGRQGHGPVGASTGACVHPCGTLAAHDRRVVQAAQHPPDRRPGAPQRDPETGRAGLPLVQHGRVRVVGGDPAVRVLGDGTGVRGPRGARAAAARGRRRAVRGHARRPIPPGARPPRRVLPVRGLDRVDRRRDAARVAGGDGLPRGDRGVDDADPRPTRAQRAPPGARPRPVRADRGQRGHEHRGGDRPAAGAPGGGGDPHGGASRARSWPSSRWSPRPRPSWSSGSAPMPIPGRTSRTRPTTRRCTPRRSRTRRPADRRSSAGSGRSPSIPTPG